MEPSCSKISLPEVEVKGEAWSEGRENSRGLDPAGRTRLRGSEAPGYG